MLAFSANDWRGVRQTIKVKGRLVETCHGVHLIEQSRGKFVVVYGLQVSAPASLTKAMTEFGSCLIHSMICSGKVAY